MCRLKNITRERVNLKWLKDGYKSVVLENIGLPRESDRQTDRQTERQRERVSEREICLSV